MPLTNLFRFYYSPPAIIVPFFFRSLPIPTRSDYPHLPVELHTNNPPKGFFSYLCNDNKGRKNNFNIRIIMKTNIFIASLLMLCLAACGPKYKTLPMDEFEAAIAKPDVVVVDVRTPQEFAEGHIAGAINIDWKAGNFGPIADELLDDDDVIALYCIHANRSKKAAEMLVKMGYRHVVELEGGLEPWMAAGKPVEKAAAIPYMEADNYFVRNDATLPLPAKFDSQEAFDSCFGMATTMGDDGRPTTIDFATQFVIAVALPATDKDIELDDERLTDDGSTLTLEYSVERDNERNSYTQTPLLLIVVDRQYDRPNVTLKEVADR